MMSRTSTKAATSGPYTLTLPAIRGIQSGREYYVTLIPMRILSSQFLFNDNSLPPELRAQRVINKSRIPEMARYVLGNPKDYVFSAITASIDRRVIFVPYDDYDSEGRLGLLQVPADARFLINDGQHRKAAIDLAIKENEELGRETIAVVLYVDAGLKRSQQMFADLNKYAVKPTRSLGVLYDHQDPVAELVRDLMVKVPLFRDRIDKERTTVSHRSTNILTLSAVYQATRALLGKTKKLEAVSHKETNLALEFWSLLPDHIPEWKLLLQGKIASIDLRKNYVHSHGVILQALGAAGHTLITSYPGEWKTRLAKIEEIDWSRANPEWEGRAIIGGRLSKAFMNVLLATNYIKKVLGLPLTVEEQKVENSHLGVELIEVASK